MKHPLPRLAVVIAGLGLLLAGCSSSDAEPSPSGSSATAPVVSQTPTAQDVALLEAVTVAGEVGAEPTVTFEAPLEVSAPVARLDTPGTGADLKDGDVLQINYVVYSGADATKQLETWSGGSPESITLGDANAPAALNEALAGQKIGVRFVYATPALNGQPAAVLVGEVSAVLPSRAEGEPVTPADGLPTVTLDDNGKPAITIADDYMPPTEMVVQPLIKGSGPEVQPGQSVTVQYSGWTLDGEQFDSSWESGTPVTFGLSEVIQGWGQGLAGQTVGSQVLLVIPPALAYGEVDEGASPGTQHELAGQTLVFVVDILAAQ